MKKIIAVAAGVLLMAGCTKTTERNADQTSTTETTTYSATVPAIDTAATQAAKNDAVDAANNAADAAREAGKDAAAAGRDAAHATGTAMETAGQKIQEKTETRHD